MKAGELGSLGTCPGGCWSDFAKLGLVASAHPLFLQRVRLTVCPRRSSGSAGSSSSVHTGSSLTATHSLGTAPVVISTASLYGGSRLRSHTMYWPVPSIRSPLWSMTRTPSVPGAPPYRSIALDRFASSALRSVRQLCAYRPNPATTVPRAAHRSASVPLVWKVACSVWCGAGVTMAQPALMCTPTTYLLCTGGVKSCEGLSSWICSLKPSEYVGRGEAVARAARPRAMSDCILFDV
ncbi:hypothetical protein BM221_010606 [Beauveria bassiana]|uniref:Uncharacterized protein n=1 Tax=Beauveria bassiana TaxID=176275 RepID=A0A2N6N8B4_BEABA|nr:hypothetical protein BM221_010606 [Beauveria bassiana]